MNIQILKPAVLAAPFPVTLLVADCTSASDTPPGTKLVETWTTRTKFVDGKAATEKDRTVEYVKKPDKGPEWVFKGFWRIGEYNDKWFGYRDCLTELFPAKFADHTYRMRVSDRCAADMRIMAA